ncbi:fimbrial protein [Vibrio sp. FNV 38]|nr:fimbrial protein [Vibrio sp. FNV 38]
MGGSGPGGSSQYTLDTSVSVPDNAPIGQIVWRGPSTVVNVTCYKDATNHPSQRIYSEQVYFWPGTSNNQGIPHIPGIQIGFVYNGIAHYGTNRVPVDGFRVRGCYTHESNLECERNTQISLVVEYYPIIVKGPGKFQGYSQPVGIFQVDGEGGYNHAYQNYYSMIRNMDALQPTRCEVELEVEGQNIDFGSVSTTSVEAGISRPVTIKVTNKAYTSGECPAVKLRGLFRNIRDFSNNDFIPVYDYYNGTIIDGVGIRMSETNGTEIELNEPIGSGFEISGPSGIEAYNATLYATGKGAISPGAFEGVVVYSVSYL